MIPVLRAEFRKLLTVRSTYVIMILATLMAGFLAVYSGYNNGGPSPLWLSNVIGGTSSVIGIFMALIAVLLVCHEYRHNTIMYTLTYSNSRGKVLLAKMAATLAVVLAFTTFAIVFSAVAYRLGTAFSPAAGFISPDFYWSDVWRAVYYVLAYSFVGLALAVLIRHVAGVIAALFILPVVEQLLTLLLKTNSKYLPFVSLEQVHTGSLLSPGRAALLFSLYLVAVWIVAWTLFLRRDAN